ncbi:MAG: hypothetical protein V1816_20685 [Pseudomonadota bacterium]
MNIMYAVQTEDPVALEPIFLEVIDSRPNKDIVTQSVKNTELFHDVYGQLNLSVKAHDGRSTQLQGAEVDRAFFEAFRARFESLGIPVTPAEDQAQMKLSIYIDAFILDIRDKTFSSKVEYHAEFYRGEKLFLKGSYLGEASDQSVILQPKKEKGEEVLGNAFSQALNKLEPKSFTKGL